MTITKILNIHNHPIAYCSDNVKKRYVIGLGCVLHKVSNGHTDMRLLFEQWGYSILKEDVSLWFSSDNESCIGKAIKLNRRGFHFFRVKHQFYFDCFYLTETFNKSLLNALHVFLKDTGSNIFTRSALENTYKYFAEGNVALNVEESLLHHRNENITFSSKRENSVLVVATVSAGKSTLINALTGHCFNRATSGVCTTHICRIHNKSDRDGITFRKGTVFVYDSEIDAHSSDDVYEVAFHFESTLCDKRICLIDTPGVNNSQNSEHFQITSDAIKAKNYDFIIFISNGQYNGTNDERQLLNLLHSATDKPIIFVLNQLDRFNRKKDDIAKMICAYGQELISIGFKAPKIFPLSAQYALLLRNVDQLCEDEVDDLDLMRKRFANTFFDLQHYREKQSANELEKSGIILLEKEIIQHLK